LLREVMLLSSTEVAAPSRRRRSIASCITFRGSDFGCALNTLNSSP
jgi:hypothetical protein